SQGALDPVGRHHAVPDGLGARNNGKKDNRNRKEAEHDARGSGTARRWWRRSRTRLVEGTDPGGTHGSDTAERREGKVVVGLAAATAIARPKPMAQGGIASC